MRRALKGNDGVIGYVGGTAMSSPLQCIPESTDENTAHQACIAKAHFGLRGVDVDVDFRGVNFQEQGQNRVAVAC